MATTETGNLMSVATNSNLRVHERIKIIKGDDRRISSVAEARAILAIPSRDVVWTENKEKLPLAQMEAHNYLREHERERQAKRENNESNWVQRGKNFLIQVNRGIKTVKKVVDTVNNFGKFTPYYL